MQMTTRRNAIEMNADDAHDRPLSAREARRRAKLLGAVERWWNAIPEQERQPYYLGRVIEAATGYQIEHLSAALRQLGWQRVQYREHLSAPRLYWVPPGYPSPVRPLGRPPGRPSNRIPPGSRQHEQPTP